MENITENFNLTKLHNQFLKVSKNLNVKKACKLDIIILSFWEKKITLKEYDARAFKYNIFKFKPCTTTIEDLREMPFNFIKKDDRNIALLEFTTWIIENKKTL